MSKIKQYNGTQSQILLKCMIQMYMYTMQMLYKTYAFVGVNKAAYNG